MRRRTGGNPTVTPALAVLGVSTLAATAAALVIIPRSLFAEVLSGRPDRRFEALMASLVLLLGLAAFVLVPAGSPEVRLTLGLAVSVLAATVLSDIRYLTIPDLYVAAIAAVALLGPLAPPWREALAGLIVCGGLLGLIAWYWKRRTAVDGIGFGDVKLAAALGALLGPQNGLWAITISAGGGAVLALILKARRGERDTPFLFPYGAPLAIAGAGFLLAGQIFGWV